MPNNDRAALGGFVVIGVAAGLLAFMVSIIVDAQNRPAAAPPAPVSRPPEAPAAAEAAA